MTAYDLFRASVPDEVLAEGRRRRDIVATGGTCPCGAHVKDLWRDRLSGFTRLSFADAVTFHADDCPALWARSATPNTPRDEEDAA